MPSCLDALQSGKVKGKSKGWLPPSPFEKKQGKQVCGGLEKEKKRDNSLLLRDLFFILLAVTCLDFFSFSLFSFTFL